MHKEAQANFDRWFGTSKVVNADGSPKVVYHGTTADFNDFDPARTGEVSDIGFYGQGSYFTDDFDVAARYAKRALWGVGLPDPSEGAQLMPVYLSLKNPFFTKEETLSDAVLDSLKKKGHDGIISEAADDGTVEYVVFRPEQIKSAIGNSGAYNPADRDITDRKAAAQSALDFVSLFQQKKAAPHA